jgi:hypothetical protein
MDHAPEQRHPQAEGQVVDFDQAMLDACPADLRTNLLTEARLLAQAFAPDGRADQLHEMASALSSGQHDADMGRVRARQLAAALRRLARQPD